MRIRYGRSHEYTWRENDVDLAWPERSAGEVLRALEYAIGVRRCLLSRALGHKPKICELKSW